MLCESSSPFCVFLFTCVSCVLRWPITPRVWGVGPYISVTAFPLLKKKVLPSDHVLHAQFSRSTKLLRCSSMYSRPSTSALMDAVMMLLSAAAVVHLWRDVGHRGISMLTRTHARTHAHATPALVPGAWEFSTRTQQG